MINNPLKTNLFTRLAVASVAACYFSTGGASVAQTVFAEIGAARDTSIYSDSPAAPSGNNSNGAGISLLAGRIAAPDSRRVLLAFDIASSIPAGATIESVELTLTSFRNSTRDATPDDIFSLHRLTNDWGEGASDAGALGGLGTAAAPGDATWFNNFFDTSSWASDGGDFLPTPSASSPVGVIASGSLPVQWLGPGLISDVQHWLDNPTGDYGWILIGDPNNGERSARIFGSRERAEGTPLLRVGYTLVPEPLSCTLAVFVLASATCVGRRSTWVC